jgi:hypothetical protein
MRRRSRYAAIDADFAHLEVATGKDGGFVARESFGFPASAWIENRRIDMEGVKAKIRGEGVESSVEFSVEEVIARNSGKPWGEMSEAEREAAMKDYALSLFTRQSGETGDLHVTLTGGTFSTVHDGDV